MTVWRCRGCSGMWGLALTRCPRCHKDDWDVEEGLMPKARRAAGPSNAGGVPATESAAAAETEAAPAVAADQASEGGERPSVGSSSEASPEKQLPSSRKSGRGSRRPAPMTGSLSSPDGTESSTVPLMDGGPEIGTSTGDADGAPQS
jgi:hypothetical protein